ncbi:MAG: TlpA family protein disulfide reductase [Candidatus Zixiibacteriota bacterium]|nr:MAG: TlpA family protein disulfide reductase [candidate division Zixibacteria bacterium]
MRRPPGKFILALALAIILLSPAQAGKKGKAPNFTAPDLKGEKVELKNLLEEGPVLISFWATHCKPCIKELNKLGKLYADYKKRGFEILAIDVDGPRSVGRVKSKVKGLKWKFPVVFDTNKDIYRKYHVLGIPHTVLIDPDGNIRYTHTTYRPGDEKTIWKKVDQVFSEQKEASEEKEGIDSDK